MAKVAPSSATSRHQFRAEKVLFRCAVHPTCSAEFAKTCSPAMWHICSGVLSTSSAVWPSVSEAAAEARYR
jgi:hypothetical protein